MSISTENSKNQNFRTTFDKSWTNSSSPYWNPEKQSSGQMLDKYGVWGGFEFCKRPERSQGLAQKVPIRPKGPLWG